MRTNIRQVQFECTQTSSILTELKDQVSQLMSMMGEIKRKNSIGILSNTKKKPNEECDVDNTSEGTPCEDELEKELDMVAKSVVEPKIEKGTEPITTIVPFSTRLEEKERRDEAEFGCVTTLNLGVATSKAC
ncbi:hypothetical protein J1N35_014013 [Gossypium stocksii]|uniref:Acidic leucine-rich nuclear phosphoprotein 32 family member B-like n=1 Tax=Gossypium stocksii TaxID=47602 RepID=A0A9D3VTN7_9ROSI|nr:hypothetical protein J1N35_014013 [Gossypium stocksii]